jgi:CitMHS family citrate-Mg2+:H+ or citrate-Ca2+:H+ symporter
MVPAMLVGAVWVLGVAWWFGRKERTRLSLKSGPEAQQLARDDLIAEAPGRNEAALRPKLFVFNALLTAVLMALLILGVLPLAVLFMLAFAVALMVNYPSLAEQKQRLSAHAGNALAVVSLIFAAGIFMGILSGTRMVDAMAQSVLAVLPPQLGPYLAPITGLLSIPFTFFISNDAFYFGMLPVLAEAASAYGIEPAALARASLVGQQVHLLSPLVPSTYLLVGMARIEFGEHQRFTLPWALGACVVMLLAGLAFGIFPLLV